MCVIKIIVAMEKPAQNDNLTVNVSFITGSSKQSPNIDFVFHLFNKTITAFNKKYNKPVINFTWTLCREPSF